LISSKLIQLSFAMLRLGPVSLTGKRHPEALFSMTYADFYSAASDG